MAKSRTVLALALAGGAVVVGGWLILKAQAVAANLGLFVATDAFSYLPGGLVQATVQAYDLKTGVGIPGVRVDVAVDGSKVTSVTTSSGGFALASFQAPTTPGTHVLTVQAGSAQQSTSFSVIVAKMVTGYRIARRWLD